MKIVVLDGYTLNPGDLCWTDLEQSGELTVFQRTGPGNELLERAAGADILLTNKVVLDPETLNQLPDLKFISVLATGYNVVDILAARERGIVVSNVPAYSTPSVAQHVFAMLLELHNNVSGHDAAVKNGDWTTCRDFSFQVTPVVELQGLTMGILGFGMIGREVAAIARAFGMEVIAHTRTPDSIDDGTGAVELDELFSRADVLSLHCPATPQTEGIVNRTRLAKMKSTAILVNTARGSLVVEPELASALAQGRIAAACLDVLSSEPPPADHPLLRAPNCIITPHVAWGSLQARQRLMQTTVENVRGFIEGSPVNVVNRDS